MTRPTFAVLLLAVAACAGRGSGSTPAPGDASPGQTTGAPTLADLAPDTVRLGPGQLPTLVLTGRGFVPGATGALGAGGNTVRVGRALFERLPANAAGTELRFVMPFTYTDTAVRNRPASFGPGQYPVTVLTAAGESNALLLTLIP